MKESNLAMEGKPKIQFGKNDPASRGRFFGFQFMSFSIFGDSLTNHVLGSSTKISENVPVGTQFPSSHFMESDLNGKFNLNFLSEVSGEIINWVVTRAL